MTIIWYIVITVASMVIAEIIRPKAKYDPPPAAGLEDYNVPTAEEGRPIPILYGTVKLESPNVVWWEDPVAVDNKEYVKTGPWTTEAAHKGYFYYMSMHVVLCAGPLDGVEAIMFEDYVAWTGDAMDEEIFVDNLGLFGGEDSGGGVKGQIDVMSGIGSQQPNEWLQEHMASSGQLTLITEGIHVDYQEIYDQRWADETYELMINGIPGNDAQVGAAMLQAITDKLLAEYRVWLAANGYVDDTPEFLSGPEYVPAFRGVTSLVFKGFYFGTATSLRPLKIGCRRHVSGLGQGAFSKVGATKRDCNPIEILYDIMHNADYGMGIPGYRFDKESYIYAARILYEENFGMSYKISTHTDFETIINDVLRHIEAVQFISPITGLETIKLIRQDYNLYTLPKFDESNILEMLSYTRGTWEETINEVKVNFIDRDNFFTPGTVIVQDNANWTMQNSAVFSSTRVYNGIYEKELAHRIAMRDLKNMSVPLAHAQFKTNRSAYGILPGDVIDFAWADVGVVSMQLRVQQVNYGTSTDLAMTIHCIQEVTSIGYTQFVTPKGSSWLDQNINPALVGVGVDAVSLPPDYSVVTEAPYFLTHIDDELPANSTEGKYWPSASSLTASSYDVYTRTPPVETWERWERNRPINYHLKVEYPVTQYAGTIHVRGIMPVTTVTQDEAQIWRNMAQIGGELIAFTQVFNNNDGTYLLEGVIYRGIADTVPLPHVIGSDVWIFGGDIPRTDRPFAEGETIELGISLANANGVAFDNVIKTNEITFKARHFRPYPPANFQIGGVEFPLQYTDADPLVLTWSHRTRFQNNTLVDNSNTADYGPEAGTTYTLRIYGQDGDLLHTETGMTGKTYSYSHAQELIDSGTFNTRLHFQLEAVRDGYTSWQYQIRTVYRTIGSSVGGYGSTYGENYGAVIEGASTENPGTVPGVIIDPVQNPAPLPDPVTPTLPGATPGDNGVPDAVPGTGAGWELVGDEYAPSRMPAEIMNPRPAAEIGFDSRYAWSHSQMVYEVPVSVMGGAPPFYFTISGSAGASISRMSPAFNPESFSWAKVTAPAGASGTIQVNVYDQEHRTSPVATVSWTVQLKDAKFLFIDKANGSSGGYGTIAAPLRDISDWYKGSRGDSSYKGRICVYRTGTYIPDNDPTDATWNNVMHLSDNKPLGHIGFPGESVTWDFGQSAAYQGMSDNPGGNIEDLFFANLRLYRGQCHARFWYFSERHVWWDLTFDAPDVNAWEESNIGGVIYLAGRHTHISMTDVEMKDFPVRVASPYNTAGFEAYNIVSAAIDGVIGNNFRASTLVYMKSKTYRATVTNCSQWTDGEPARGAFYSTANWYGNPMAGYTEVDGDNSLLQLRYNRGFQSNDDGDGFLIASQIAYKVRGKRYADRMTSVAGMYNTALANVAFIAGSIFANDRNPIIEGNYTVDAETKQFTRADYAANTDAQGALTDGDRYKIGYLVNAPEAAPTPDPDPDPPGPIGVVGITDLDQILWASQHDGAISWDNAIDGRPLTDYTSAEDANAAVFSIDIAPLADVAHVVRQDLSDGQALQVGYDHSGLVPWAGIQLRRGDSYWVRQALYFPDGTEGLTHANGGAVPAFSFEPHATILDENYPADQAIWLERLGQYNASGGKIGDLVFGLETSGAGADISFLMEGGDQDWQSALTAGAAIPRGQWVMFEGQIVLDDKIASQGGAPAVRVWINGTLVVDRDDIRTMIEGSTSNLFYNRTFMGEWAGLVPQDQTLFFATPAIAVDIAGVRTDSANLADDPAGNSYLGMRVIPDFLVPTQGFSIHVDAEQGTVGLQDIEGSASNELTWLMESTVSDTHVFRGSKSIHCYRTGLPVYPDQGWGEWGVQEVFTPVKKGGIIHFQVSVYFPAGFDFTADPWLKFMRLHHRGTGGEHQGYHDLYIRNDTFTPDDAYGQMHLAGEVVTGNHRLVGQIMQQGVWETFEIGIVVDNVAKDSGGSAAVRVWRKVNGVMKLVIEKTSYKTIVVADGDINNAMVFGGTWNTTSDGESWPKTTQEAWLDEFKIETDLTKMTQTDSAGNKIIGL